MYRLLVVDDEKDIRENIQYLIDWGRYGISQIETAATYEEAVNKALDIRPHIILMDVKLGDGRWGYELVEYLRASGLKAVCCMISGYDEFTYVQRSMQAAARDYLLKPINEKELGRFVERAIVEGLNGRLPQRQVDLPDVDPVLKVEYGTLSRITNKIIMIVKGNYRNSLSLVGIGDMFCMSSKYIGRIFLQDTGMKFSEYLMAYRMVQAKRLIETTGDKIVVIAGQVGYTQLNNFYVHFKEYYGFSPKALRGTEETEKNAYTEERNGMESPENTHIAGNEKTELPGTTAAEESRTEESRTEENRTAESRTEENRTAESRTEENRTAESRTEENRTEENRTAESRAEESRAEENRTEENRTEENRTAESRAEENRTGENRTAESRAEENRTGENRTAESRAEENRTAESRTGENRTEENEAEEEQGSAGAPESEAGERQQERGAYGKI